MYVVVFEMFFIVRMLETMITVGTYVPTYECQLVHESISSLSQIIYIYTTLQRLTAAHVTL